jgi:2,4-didehydro-3-deoxy-L-rhamnonate hydrolase
LFALFDKVNFKSVKKLVEMVPFSLATIQSASGARAVVRIGRRYYFLAELSPDFRHATVKTILEDWERCLPKLEELNSLIEKENNVHGLPLDRVQLHTPVLWPNKVMCVGANYADHLKEMGMEPKKWDIMPFFLCPPTTSLVGPGETVEIPKSTQQFDWELELVVVVGKRLRHSSLEEAKKAIAGYSIGLDLSCRDLTTVDNEMRVDLVRGKSQDSMKPVGPHIVPAEFLPDVSNLKLRLDVNGEQMMDSSTKEMLYSCEEILSVISQFVTLEPGDLVFTGSPQGSAGAHGDRWLKPGDHIRAEIEGVGVFNLQMKQPVA